MDTNKKKRRRKTKKQKRITSKWIQMSHNLLRTFECELCNDRKSIMAEQVVGAHSQCKTIMCCHDMCHTCLSKIQLQTVSRNGGAVLGNISCPWCRQPFCFTVSGKRLPSSILYNVIRMQSLLCYKLDMIVDVTNMSQEEVQQEEQQDSVIRQLLDDSNMADEYSDTSDEELFLEEII